MLSDSFAVLLPDRRDFTTAREWLCRFDTSLRAGDALHLAIAANHGAEAILSLDKRMIASGKKLALPTSARGLPGYGGS